MTTPDHIKRIIERIDPADREALEQHLKDESNMGQLMCLQKIRQAIGDPHGKLMQDDLVERVRELVAERDALAAQSETLKFQMEVVKRQRNEEAVRLRKAYDDWRDCRLPNSSLIHEMQEELRNSPSASLAEIKTQAMKKGYWQGFKTARVRPDDHNILQFWDEWQELTKRNEDHAARIRKEAL